MLLHQRMADRLARIYLTKLRDDPKEADRWAREHANNLSQEQLHQLKTFVKMLKPRIMG